MSRLTPAEIERLGRPDFAGMSHRELEEMAWRLREAALTFANRLDGNSTNSSRPPSSDPPWSRRGGDRPSGSDAGAASSGDAAASSAQGAQPSADGAAAQPAKPARPPGKRPGAPGYWRSQPIVATGEPIEHSPAVCSQCGLALGAACKGRMVGAHYVYELERGSMALQVTVRKHCYFAARCSCGHETIAAPGVGLRSEVEGRKRQLEMSERCLIGPMLATFIAGLAMRYRLSRLKVREFLNDWLGLELGVASINRCVHEFGLASEPIVEDLLQEVRAAELVNIDETPWYQSGVLLWLWVATSACAVVFRIGSRRKEELIALIGEAFLGWLVSDGYKAYRDHPRRQRCLAHLIRKAVALAEGYYDGGCGFGRSLARDLRRLIERVAEGGQEAACKRLAARIRCNCRRNAGDIEEKVRSLAREILNDWEAVIAFVDNPSLPPTNNDAERALRHAVIARRISYGTRTDEGSRFYAASLSVIETCRKRGRDPWTYARDLIQAARTGAPLPKIPTAAAAA
jgi:transposase